MARTRRPCARAQRVLRTGLRARRGAGVRRGRRRRRAAASGRHERALLAPGAEREKYLERAMSGNKRKKLRRQRRRLEDIAPVRVTTATGTPDIEGALKDFMVLEASGWKGLAG